MNYDEFEPVSQEAGGYYSTGRPSQGRRHVGLVVVLSTVMVLGCAGAAIASLFDLRVDREPGRTSLIITEKNPDVSATRVMSANVGDLAPIGKEESDAAVLQIAQPPLREEGEMSLSEIYEKVIPSVVSVISTTPSGSETGCGVIMSPDGYIITDCQTVLGDRAITVLMGDDTEHVASVVGTDDASDLAVLKIDAKDLRAGEFGDADALSVGEQVVCIGDPMGLELRGTMTDGIICGINRNLSLEQRTMTILQTNAAPSVGAFGGPLINRYGQIVGINVHSIGGYSGEGVEGLSFAIPIGDAKAVVDELIEFGAIPGRPAIGISGQAVPEAAQAYYQLPEGVYVDDIILGGAAEAAGVHPGDIITAINGMAVSSMDELNLFKNRYKSGDSVVLRIFRGDITLEIPMVLGESR